MLGNRLNNILADVIVCVWGQYVFRVAENSMFMRSASWAINKAPVICIHCFFQASEQDGDIMCCVFTFTLSPQCGGNVGV